MEKVIVTVLSADEGHSLDLELPTNLPVDALRREIVLALGWSDNLQVFANPPGRVLEPSETLAQAEAWDGAFLIFQPVGSPSPRGGKQPVIPSPAPSPARSKGDSPVTGWLPLDLPAAAEEKPSNSPPASDGFIWKQVDED